MATKDLTSRPTRRDLAKLALGAGALAAAPAFAQSAATSAITGRKPSNFRSEKPNILFVFTDQERYRSEWPKGLSLPGHDRLRQSGVTFHNHHCPATMCTSSRSVMLTGLSTVDNGMFEHNTRYVGNPLHRDLRLRGHMPRKLGYYTAYKGKWHLNRALTTMTACC